MIEGWLTDGQAARLAAAAARSRPDGAVVEIGSFRGKSAVVLASTAGSLIAIDPHAGSDRGPQEIEAGRGARRRGLRRLPREPGRRRRRRPRPARAQVLLRRPSGRDRTAVAAVRGRRAPLRTGAGGPPRLGPAGRARRRDARARRVLVDRRDARAAGGVRAVAARGATSGGPAPWPSTSGVASGPRDVGAFARELPWFARNVLIKVLVVAGRRRWAERLGLDPAAPWPY